MMTPMRSSVHSALSEFAHSAPDPLQNHLLAALEPAARERIFPCLKRVTLLLGRVLCEPGQPMRHAFFPTNAIISLLGVMRNGASAEISLVGHEGLIGVATFLGDGNTTSRAVVQSAGSAFSIDSRRLREEFNACAGTRMLMLRYTQALITQIGQTAVCNRHHTVEQRLCRWLLQSLDRLPENRLEMTHEMVANMLGVRREGVTAAAGRLQAQGVIQYRRGHVAVTDRRQLEQLCCECYVVEKRETERLCGHRARPGVSGCTASGMTRNHDSGGSVHWKSE